MADKLFGTLFDENEGGQYNRHQHGVFGLHPLATPKYAANKGLRDNEFKESLARMYISLAGVDDAAKQAYLKSLPPDARVQALAKVFTSAGQKAQTGFIDFFLQQVNESFMEARQVDKVLGDNYVAFYFGQEPPVFQYSGSLLNSQQDDQRTGFALAYQHLLRGTRMAQHGSLLRLRYDSVIVSGTIETHSQVLNAENEMIVPFNFSLLVKEYIVIQSPRFQRLSQKDFVQLSTSFADFTKLGSVGESQDVRVRSTMLTPDQLSAESAAGQEERIIVDQPNSTPLTTLDTAAKDETLISTDDVNTRGLALPPPESATPWEATQNIGIP